MKMAGKSSTIAANTHLMTVNNATLIVVPLAPLGRRVGAKRQPEPVTRRPSSALDSMLRPANAHCISNATSAEKELDFVPRSYGGPK
jgi:hypothetical protein